MGFIKHVITILSITSLLLPVTNCGKQAIKDTGKHAIKDTSQDQQNPISYNPDCIMQTQISGTLGDFDATYDYQHQILVIDIYKIDEKIDGSTPCRIVAAENGSNEIHVIETVYFDETKRNVEIPFSFDSVQKYQKLGIELTDRPVGESEYYAIGAMPGSECTESK